MPKIRPVVVISPRLPYRSGLATIVPISLTPPRHDLPFVIRLSRNYHPSERDDLACWAKCDLVTNVSLERLQGFKVGRRKRETPRMNGEDLRAVREGVIHGLGMSALSVARGMTYISAVPRSSGFKTQRPWAGCSPSDDKLRAA